MRWLLRLSMIAAFALASLLPASGANVIFYSKDDNSYGWCAGYSYGRGESCARANCLDYGSRCELAIECDGAWSAAAFSYDPWKGFGASCQFKTAESARSIALGSCIYVTHDLCYTSDVFNGGGRSLSAKANKSFDSAWYTQQLLLLLGYDIGDADGDIGSRTRDAIRQVQSAAGLEADGEASWGLIYILLYLYGGTTRLAQAFIADTDGLDQGVVNTYSYRYASKPADDLSLGAELAALSDGDRLNALAAILTYNNRACTRPATSAIQDESNPDGWLVSCAEGNFALFANGDETIVTVGDTLVVPPDDDCPVIDVDDGGDDDSLHPGGTQDVHGGAGGLTVADNASSEEQDFKPTNNIVGGMAPGIGPGPEKPCPPRGAKKANGDSDSEVDPFKPTNNIVGAPPPNLMDGYTNDADPDDPG